MNWHEVYLYAERLAAGRGVALDHQLLAGTPRWCGMPDTDARKLMSLLLGGVRDALRNDTRQEAVSDASSEISTAADWPAVAQRVRNGRGAAYIPREVA
ncbi:DUF2742 domain-containing protein [Mycolicibacterium sphagni]|uniref:DUF2742 domain-containing protein n=1 Tax=Mycolicibacterium sphagni TaxID=1786 RepID=UPI0021F26A4B|nr:DUF2742 domain-containing protein [Mycolicibacterium sphagni]MCV7176764.1 DUF2742 domain-containing protein [Mycolicibacterium sphagni]